MKMQEELYNLLVQKDEITWQSLIMDLIRTEQMNPWDIDVSILVEKYLQAVKELKEINFFISGKVLLAASILLRVKSDKLVAEDIAGFDTLLHPPEEEFGEFEDDFDAYLQEFRSKNKVPPLAIKTPQTRKKIVTINDLMSALQKALDVDKKRAKRIAVAQKFLIPEIPEKKIDISSLIRQIYNKIKDFFSKKETLTFNELVNSERKEDKILTFVPLLHLVNDGKLDLEQMEHFGEINIVMKKN